MLLINLVKMVVTRFIRSTDKFFLSYFVIFFSKDIKISLDINPKKKRKSPIFYKVSNKNRFFFKTIYYWVRIFLLFSTDFNDKFLNNLHHLLK